MDAKLTIIHFLSLSYQRIILIVGKNHDLVYSIQFFELNCCNYTYRIDTICQAIDISKM